MHDDDNVDRADHDDSDHDRSDDHYDHYATGRRAAGGRADRGCRGGYPTRAAAAAAVQKAFHRTLPVVIDGAVLQLDPTSVASGCLDAVGRTRCEPGSDVDLVVVVRGLAACVGRQGAAAVHARSGRRVARAEGGPPPPDPGPPRHDFDRRALRRHRRRAASSRAPVRPHLRSPAITTGSIGPAILINRGLTALPLPQH
jgi:hypothetical protein